MVAPAAAARAGRAELHEHVPLGRTGTEDFAFCERARRAGESIFVDTRVRLFHVGSYGYGWEDAGRDPERFTSYEFRFR